MIFSQILLTFLSIMFGPDIKEIKKIYEKRNKKNIQGLEISNSIDAVSKKLEDSKEIIENALIEIKKQKILFEELKKDAIVSQQITSMNQEQVEAMNKLLERTLNKQEKKSFPKNILMSLFFCILGAVLGIYLSKIF